MGQRVRIDNAVVMTMVEGDEPSVASVSFDSESGAITHVGADRPRADRVLDAAGGVLLPGFVQTHIHLCQTLFRNLADDLSLLDWLRLRIWPMEAALKAEDMRAAADLGLAELALGGTTSILDMGTVEHTDQIGEAVRRAGTRAFIGKAMMDKADSLPQQLREDTQRSLRESSALADRWHGQADGRIGYAFAPRFAPSCTPELLKTVAEICQDRGLLIHTHCAESRDEIALVEREYGLTNLEFLADMGLTGDRSVFAHMIHLDETDLGIVERSNTRVAHCPSSNCKLASGVAPIPLYLSRGISVSLGADGAPCNNRLDALSEVRLAALLHKPRFGPKAMPAETVLALATREGARALGIDDRVGTIEVGKRADLVHFRLDRPSNGVAGSVASKLVYTASRQNVVDVWCDGRQLVQDRQLTQGDLSEIMAAAEEAAGRVLRRL